jgi:hypothetical protein
MTQSFALFIADFILLSLAYLVVVTISGYAEAWAANRAGDDSVSWHFLTLNPLPHFNFIGYVIMLLFHQFDRGHLFGFGNTIPVDATRIRGKWRKTKLAFVHWSSSIALIMAAMIIFIIVVGLFDIQIFGNFHVVALAQLYPNATTPLLMVGSLCMHVSILALRLAMVLFIFNTYYFLASVSQKGKQPLFIRDPYVGIVVFLVIMLFAAPIIQTLFNMFALYGGVTIAQLLGLV